MNDWLIERLDNLVADVLNGEPLDVVSEAQEIRRYMAIERRVTEDIDSRL